MPEEPGAAARTGETVAPVIALERDAAAERRRAAVVHLGPPGPAPAPRAPQRGGRRAPAWPGASVDADGPPLGRMAGGGGERRVGMSPPTLRPRPHPLTDPLPAPVLLPPRSPFPAPVVPPRRMATHPVPVALPPSGSSSTLWAPPRPVAPPRLCGSYSPPRSFSYSLPRFISPSLLVLTARPGRDSPACKDPYLVSCFSCSPQFTVSHPQSFPFLIKRIHPSRFPLQWTVPPASVVPFPAPVNLSPVLTESFPFPRCSFPPL